MSGFSRSGDVDIESNPNHARRHPLSSGTTVAVLACVALVAVSCSVIATENGSTSTTRTPSPTSAAVSTTEASSISEVTVTPTASPARPLGILASQMSTDAGPIVWEWLPDSKPDPVHSPAFRAGDCCYGNSEPPPPSNRDMTFLDGTLTVLVGRHVPPTVLFEDEDGVTDLGNPFGE